MKVHFVRSTVPKQYGIKYEPAPRLKAHKEWYYSMAVSTVCHPDPGCITPTTCIAHFFFLSSFLASFLGAGFATGFAKDHAAVVKRFGRFPHRNTLLGRASTPEEEAHLASAERKSWES